MQRDEFFKDSIKKSSDFTFSNKVASVFDDMVNRSVPFYEEIQRMIGELAADNYQENTTIYDLGCSTGTTMVYMNKVVPPHIPFIGVDDSKDMLNKCQEKLKALGITRDIKLEVADLSQNEIVKNASVVVLSLTLQFLRPMNREKLIKHIFDGTVCGGVLIFIEKLVAEDSALNRDFIKYYYDMKRRNNYSDMEIAQKREALENVLIPYKLSENLLLLRNAGFGHCEVFFKWYNFSGIIAKKY
ncbi:MAG: carboxy-S-adenosyl-L-methionine synthase CmoA [Ferruginibacter sp.]